jgi:phosphatidylserine/phosphatidylglycerophosphate/cardiolipin synthase-like enzyme
VTPDTPDAPQTRGNERLARLPEATTGSDVRSCATELATRFGPAAVRITAARLTDASPEQVLLSAVPAPGFPDAVTQTLQAARAQGWGDDTLAVYLTGVADGYDHRFARVSVETVWSGPATQAVPVRENAQVLTDLITHARSELLLMTYSARPHPPITTALREAIARGVRIDVVVETLAGAGGALAGSEPAAAFLNVPGVRLWHWPPVARPEPGARMHAKIAVADRSVLLVTSANLTQSGAEKNIEAGLLVHGGHAAARVVEHVAQLQADGVLARLRAGPGGG